MHGPWGVYNITTLGSMYTKYHEAIKLHGALWCASIARNKRELGDVPQKSLGKWRRSLATRSRFGVVPIHIVLVV